MKLRQIDIILLGTIIIMVAIISYYGLSIKPTFQAESKSQFSTQPSQNMRSLNEASLGINKQAFPAIIKPSYADPADVPPELLTDRDTVYIFPSKSTLYVYPARILTYHHIVNETIDGEPLILSLCALTDSAIVQSRKVDGKVKTFEVLGSLYYGNLVMYDKEDDSSWIQLTGESISGPSKGKVLTTLGALEQTTWGTVKNTPNVKVLVSEEQSPSFYMSFLQTSRSNWFGLDVYQKTGNKLDERLPAFTRGLGIMIQDEAKYYPNESVIKQKIINDTVGGWAILIIKDSSLGTTRIFRRYIDSQTLTFDIQDGDLIDQETESTWTFNGRAIAGTMQGKQLEKPVYIPAYWFAWSAFYPDTGYWKSK